jgi:UDP-N-acetylmuramate--alanine ligase
VRAALSALRELGESRLIAVFQPHLYSRTKAFAEEFGAALALADEAVVLDVYPAREEPVGALAGVDGLLVARAAADRMGGRRVTWAPSVERAGELLARRLGPGRVLVTVGAGDVFKVAEELVG